MPPPYRACVVNNNLSSQHPHYKKPPLLLSNLFGPTEKGIAYVSFLVNHQARANALMPPVSLPTIMAGSSSGAKPAV